MLAMRNRTLLAVLAAMSLLTVSCAGSSSDTAQGATPRATHTTSVTAAAHDRAPGPSPQARMICGSEIRAAIKLTFGLSALPSSSHTWSDQIFTCNYDLGGATLALSVQDSSSEKAGQAYFAGLQSRLAGAVPIGNPRNFGFPAFRTPDGNVVFLKDGKTLRVDASALPSAAAPQGYTVADGAYGVASAVIGCWTE
jgi:hypothetical protein